ncbi:MAG TPA: hypothetical protein VEZ26_04450 [Sphingomonadaceae bacterium]|nr:hypothetical protein [Sphingomonadaceae bacterium]
MFKSRSIRIFAALLASSTAAITATSVQARQHGHVTIAKGPYGGGYAAGRHVSRQPGSAQVTRGAVTRGGYGYRQTRTTTRGDGTISNSVERQRANGTSMSRSSTATRNPDGSISTQRNRTGAGGNSQDGWSTIYRTDDGYTRQRGGSTSNGRGYASTRDVSVNDGSVTVNRSATTNSGRSVTSSRTYPRPD